jgi:ankyrin repeat protein
VKFLLSSEVVRLFPKIDPCAINNSPIKLASQYGHLDIVKFLLSDEILTLYPEIDPKALDNVAIYLAHRYGHLDVVEFLRIHVYNSAPLSDILENKI